MPRVSLVDRPWMDYGVTLTLGPIEVPPVDDIRDGLAALALADPTHPLVSRLDADRWQWRPIPRAEMDEHLHHVVTTSPALDQCPSQALLADHTAAISAQAPLRIVVGRRGLLIAFGHVLGDGVASFSLVQRLLTCRQTPDRFLDLLGPSSDRLLLRAIARFYGRQPGRIMATALAPRPRPGTPVTVHQEASISQTGDTPGSSVTVLTARFDAGVCDALQRQARSLGGISRAAVLFSSTCRAFAKSGLDMDTDGANILVDARRYLRQPAPLMANMAKSVYIRPSDLFDSRSFHTEMHSVIASGRSLAGTAAAALKQVVAQERPNGSDDDTLGRISLGLSYLNQIGSVDDLPWRPGKRWLTTCSRPGSPSDIALFFIRMQEGIQVSASFIPERIAPEVVRTALDQVPEIVNAAGVGATPALC